mgnify:CR=1 FL=1
MTRQFIITAEAWYGPSLRDSQRSQDPVAEVMFGLVGEGGGGSEMALRWYSLGGKTPARLEAFDGSWHVLPELADVIAALAKNGDKPLSVEGFAQMLQHLGFTDATERTVPGWERSAHARAAIVARVRDCDDHALVRVAKALAKDGEPR